MPPEVHTKKTIHSVAPQFTLPVEEQLDSSLHESVYTVDYQDIRIIVLNSNEKPNKNQIPRGKAQGL